MISSVGLKSCPRVALCIDRAQGYGSTILRGIARYVETFGPWSLYIDPRFLGDYAQNWIEQWDGDGILGYIEDPRLAKAVRRSGKPLVEMFGHRHDLKLPQVCTDNQAIGRLAAQHLVERKFRHFSYCGYQGMPWSDLRQEGFVETIRKAGFRASVHLLTRQARTLSQWGKMQHPLLEWVRSLPLPNGIMACSDRHAQRILDACRRAGISVPEEVAVIGAGNDEELCRLSDPPLTSVIYDTERIGYTAAEKLGRLMSGEDCMTAPVTTFIPPLGIATRRSTEITAIDDRLMANVVRYIREHATEGLKVKQITGAFHISRSALYRRFQNALGRAPHEEIFRVQMERARALLKQTDLTVERVSEMSGFENPEYLYVVFKRETGMTPRQFRKQR
jgi:LacI family transcriptional regulator